MPTDDENLMLKDALNEMVRTVLDMHDEVATKLHGTLHGTKAAVAKNRAMQIHSTLLKNRQAKFVPSGHAKRTALLSAATEIVELWKRDKRKPAVMPIPANHLEALARAVDWNNNDTAPTV